MRPKMLIEGAHTLNFEHLRRIMNFFDVSMSIFEGAQILKSEHLGEHLRLDRCILAEKVASAALRPLEEFLDSTRRSDDKQAS
jgi:hypothetical protein